MLKLFATLSVVVAFLLAGPCVAQSQGSGSHATASKVRPKPETVPPTHVVIDPPLSISAAQPSSSSQQPTNENPLPWFERPEWVSVIVTIVYTWFAGTTWLAIKRQADTMDAQARKAIEDAASNAAMTQETLAAIKRQADSLDKQAGHMAGQLEEMRKAREIENKTLILQYRPRLIIRNTVTKDYSVTIGQNIKCTVAFQLVNMGGSPAHVIHGEVYLLAVDASDLKDIRISEGNHGEMQERSLQPGERQNFEDLLDSSIVADEEWAAFHQGQNSSHSLYLLGTIWYKDDLGIPRQVGVHRKYDPSNLRFIPQNDSEEEYSD